MDLSSSWAYLRGVAAERLSHNKTSRHIDRYGEEIELLGAAGELAARRFLKLPTSLHRVFDGGADFIWKGWRVDVKATRLTPRLEFRYLQWPETKPIRADLVLLTAVNVATQAAVVVGWATADQVAAAPVNPERDYPCHEIPVPSLRPPSELLTIEPKEAHVGQEAQVDRAQAAA